MTPGMISYQRPATSNHLRCVMSITPVTPVVEQENSTLQFTLRQRSMMRWCVVFIVRMQWRRLPTEATRLRQPTSISVAHIYG